MRRRLAVVVAAAAAFVALGVAPHGEAATAPVKETNGCIIVYPLKTVICIPRL